MKGLVMFNKFELRDIEYSLNNSIGIHSSNVEIAKEHQCDCSQDIKLVLRYKKLLEKVRKI